MPTAASFLSSYRCKGLSKLGEPRAGGVDKANFKTSREVSGFEDWKRALDVIWKKSMQEFSKGCKMRNPLAAVASCL